MLVLALPPAVTFVEVTGGMTMIYLSYLITAEGAVIPGPHDVWDPFTASDADRFVRRQAIAAASAPAPTPVPAPDRTRAPPFDGHARDWRIDG